MGPARLVGDIRCCVITAKGEGDGGTIMRGYMGVLNRSRLRRMR